jgi:carboxypeptidase T
MKPHNPILAIVCLFLFSFSFAQEKYSTVKIKVQGKDKKNYSELIGQLEIDHFYFDNEGDLIAEIGQREMSVLKNSRYSYRVVIDDVQANLKKQNDEYYALRKAGKLPQERMALDGVGKTVNNIIQTPAAFEVKSTFGGYYSYAEMIAAMDALVLAYPSLAQKINLGLSAESRTIWAIKISDNVTIDDANEPDVLYMGLQHAREAIGGSSMIFFMQYLCEQYASDSRIKSLVDAREIVIIPCVNPDGWEYNRLNGGAGSGWRKNRRFISGTNYGVDLNRNYSVDWGTCASVTCGASASCGSNNASQDTYYGPSAFSEPETRAVRDLCYARNFVAAIDQHAFGPYYSLPYGKTARTLTALENRFFTYVPALMGQYNGMRAGNSCESVGYEVAGGVKDWWLIGNVGTGSKGKVWGMTGEGGAGGGTGGSFGSFWAPASQIINLCKGMTFQNLQLAYAAGSYVDIQDVNDLDVNSLSGNFNFSLTRVGLKNDPVTVTLVPIENIPTVGAPVTINSLPNYYDTYSGSISYTLHPATPAGLRIKYAWKIETGGYVYYDTVTKVYSPDVVFSDDMEAATTAGKWTVSGGWNYSTDFRYQGSKSLSESPAANYPASVGTTTRMAVYNGATIDLTGATVAMVSFWVRHRAENFRDKLNVEVSTNGTTWTAIDGTTTVREPGTLDGSTINGTPALTGIREIWTKEVFDLSSVLNNANVRFRFRFTSDANTTGFDYQVDQGFNIDNFKIIKTTTPQFSILPLDFLSFNGRLLPDETVYLDWDVANEVNHEYFEIEKSIDGTTFSAIGKVTGIPPYNFTDVNPIEGINYYRLRQVDKDGKYSFSKTIKVTYLPKTYKVSIYPNPVKNTLNIEVPRKGNHLTTIIITDITGKFILRQTYQQTTQNNIIKIDVSSWKSQQYIVKVMNEKGETISLQQFLR